VVVAPFGAALEGTGLRARVAILSEEHARKWWSTPAQLPALGPHVGFRGHLANSRAAARLVDDLADEIERVPEGERERRAWREAVRERLQRFGEMRLGWPAGYRRLLFADDFFTASAAFAREARAFDPGLSLEDLGQALRNVWIANSLQMVLGLPVVLNDSLFAYSMLYPLTDNLLDDPRVAPAAKRAFGERLRSRLAGLPVNAAGAAESAIFRLLGRIEEELPRHRFPDVYSSLLAIHAAQVRSLRQQDDPGLTPAEIVGISCEKGGSSVLADLYLVAGKPSLSDERLAFGYGVFLQLLDDLQDAERDAASGHQTTFTFDARRGPLDEPAARLGRFIDDVLDGAEGLDGPARADLKDLIRRNCRTLLVAAVSEQPRRFTRRFRWGLSRQWPLSLRAMRRLRHRSERRFRDAARRRAGGAGTLSLLDRAIAEGAQV
jgi:hypothetical protein